MKPGALLVNTSRGAIVNESALVQALESGHLGGVYLDVFEDEPLPAFSPSWQLPNVLITPHAADNVKDWSQRYGLRFTENLERWNDCRPSLSEISIPSAGS